MKLNETANVGRETRKSHLFRIHSGFYERYCHGVGIEVGCQGYTTSPIVPVVPGAAPLNEGAKDYDGLNIPLPDERLDFVFSSHVLEHIENWAETIREWYRVVKIGGYIIIVVPHQYLYEKKKDLPSLYNTDHKRFYTPGSLVSDIQCCLPPNSYRVAHLKDNDTMYDYSIPPEKHAAGCHEIELVIKKIQKPDWDLS